MQSSTQKAFDEIFKEHENNFCFECGSPSNHWASVNNGVFLCLNCSGLHRGFGVNVSFVRSVNMDSWSDLQLAMMRNGGNAKLRAFFEEYNFPKEGPIDFKYRTKAGAYYREMLKALAEGKPVPNPPGSDEGRELLSNKNPNFNAGNITGFGSTPAKEETALDKVVSFMGSAVDKTVNVTKETAQKVADPTFQDGVKQGVVNFGSTVATGTIDVAGKVADKSKEIWTNRDEYIQKSSESVKLGFFAAVGFVKRLGGAGAASDQSQGQGQGQGQNQGQGQGQGQ